MSTLSSAAANEETKRLFSQFVSEYSKLKEQDRQHVRQGMERVNTVMAITEACDKTLNDLQDPYKETQKLLIEVGSVNDETTKMVNKTLKDQLTCEKLRDELVQQIASFETVMKTLEYEHAQGARMMEFGERLEIQFSVLEENSAQHVAAFENIKAKLQSNTSKLQDALEEIEFIKQTVSVEEAEVTIIEKKYESQKQATEDVFAKKVELQNSINDAAIKAQEIKLQIDQKREALIAHKNEIERIHTEGEAACTKTQEEHFAAVSEAHAKMKEFDEKTELLIAELSEISTLTEQKLNKLSKKKAELAEKEKFHQVHKAKLEAITDCYTREFGDAKIGVSATVDDSGAIDFSSIAARAICSTPVTHRLEETIQGFGPYLPASLF